MRQIIYLIIVLALLVSCHSKSDSVTNPDPDTGTVIEPDKDNAGLTVPNGFSALVYADNIGRARHLVINSNGDVYVSLSSLKNNSGIVCLRDNNKDGRADEIKYFGDYTGTGIKLHKGYLYFDGNTKIVRYKLLEEQLVPNTSPEVIAMGFDSQVEHTAKAFTFDNQNHIYITVGAPTNTCQVKDRAVGSPGIDPCPWLDYHAGIWRFNADVLNQDITKVGYRYATGIRNTIAVDWNFTVNKLYAVQHGRDQLGSLWPDIYSDEQNAQLPAEEFLLVTDKSDFGWPYCYYDPIQKKKVLSPEYGGDGKIDGRCSNAENPIMDFPAHTAPNDMLFYTGSMFPSKYKNGAFIAFHGSWNRSPLPQEGYYVAFVPFQNGLPSGEWEIFANGFAGVGEVSRPSDAKHRPCGLAQAPDGALFVSDDANGRVYRIAYR